jgi:hypothetical protein
MSETLAVRPRAFGQTIVEIRGLRKVYRRDR